MSKAAFASWNNRIAPVFDVARSIQLVVIETGQIISQAQASLSGNQINLKAWRLAEWGVDTLVCGAISSPLQAMVAAYGIEVIPFVAGDLQQVIQAWVDGKLADSSAYTMPGCRNAAGSGFNNIKPKNRRSNKMKGNKRGNNGTGQGSGNRGPANRGKGCKAQRPGHNGQIQKSGSSAFSTMGDCVCPKCGHTAPHERGTPCMHLKCAQCGAVMIKE